MQTLRCIWNRFRDTPTPCDGSAGSDLSFASIKKDHGFNIGVGSWNKYFLWHACFVNLLFLVYRSKSTGGIILISETVLLQHPLDQRGGALSLAMTAGPTGVLGDIYNLMILGWNLARKSETAPHIEGPQHYWRNKKQPGGDGELQLLDATLFNVYNDYDLALQQSNWTFY